MMSSCAAPAASRASRYTSGSSNRDAPVSQRCCCHVYSPTRPPSLSFFSSTVTRAPRFASLPAVARPPTPPPTTTTCGGCSAAAVERMVASFIPPAFMRDGGVSQRYVLGAGGARYCKCAAVASQRLQSAGTTANLLLLQPGSHRDHSTTVLRAPSKVLGLRQGDR